MSSAKAGTSRSRCSGGEPRPRAGSPVRRRATSGTLARRHTSGRRELAEAGAGADHRTEHGRPPAGVDVAAGVVPRDGGDLARADAEEAAGPVDGGRRVVDDVAVAQHQDPLGVDVLVQVVELLAVQPELAVAPERRPARPAPARPAGRTPSRSRRPARARRTTGASSSSRPGRSGRGPPRSGVRRAAPRRSGGARRGSTGRTACSRRGPRRVGRRANRRRTRRARQIHSCWECASPGPRQAGGGAPSQSQYFGSFGSGHEDLGVLRQRRVQGRGAGLRGADDQEVGLRWSDHGSLLSKLK